MKKVCVVSLKHDCDTHKGMDHKTYLRVVKALRRANPKMSDKKVQTEIHKYLVRKCYEKVSDMVFCYGYEGMTDRQKYLRAVDTYGQDTVNEMEEWTRKNRPDIYKYLPERRWIDER